MALEDGLFSDYYTSMADLGYSRVEAANKLAAEHGIEQIEVAPVEVAEEDKSWGYGVDDVTKDMTTVDANTGLLGGHAGGLMDRAAQAAFQPYAIMRAIQGFVEPEYEAGTPTETFKQVADWWGNLNLPGLVAEPTYSNESLFAQSLDEGSYTDMGDYSYGTIDGIGVESPY